MNKLDFAFCCCYMIEGKAIGFGEQGPPGDQQLVLSEGGGVAKTWGRGS